jgi:hypothetical protein
MACAAASDQRTDTLKAGHALFEDDDEDEDD